MVGNAAHVHVQYTYMYMYVYVHMYTVITLRHYYLMIIAKEPEDLGVTFGLCDLLDADRRAIVTAHGNKRELITCIYVTTFQGVLSYFRASQFELRGDPSSEGPILIYSQFRGLD